jgi:hypothetical protein
VISRIVSHEHDVDDVLQEVPARSFGGTPQTTTDPRERLLPGSLHSPAGGPLTESAASELIIVARSVSATLRTRE